MSAARDLFYRLGIRAVGVDAIAEAAATNKMTLYRHFGSKDVLIEAYVQELADEADARWEAIIAAHPDDARAQVKAWLDHVEQVVNCSGERGCALANAAVDLRGPDHPAVHIVDAYKMRKRARLIDLFARAGYENPEVLADEVFLLFEGARLSLQCYGGPEGPGARLMMMLRRLLSDPSRP
ncbi:MAG: TetR/AcrR family transcriptional regulator [Hyphomicrobiaceae bacterium]|nr:TetR/AcrR family transcriptional regulator [Hyphomicrobiaceae bacterium]